MVGRGGRERESTRRSKRERRGRKYGENEDGRKRTRKRGWMGMRKGKERG